MNTPDLEILPIIGISEQTDEEKVTHDFNGESFLIAISSCELNPLKTTHLVDVSGKASNKNPDDPSCTTYAYWGARKR